MLTSEFDYNLPAELIAKHPMEPRDAARMLVMDKFTGVLHDSFFYDLDKFLQSGDVLVLNDSKVIPARIIGESEGRKFEVLLVKQAADQWECWVRPGRKLKAGDRLIFGHGLEADYVKREKEIFYLKFNKKDTEFFSILNKIGEMPIPPYILKARNEAHEEKTDESDYQTVYAREYGSVAAPTAGLHFTDDLLLKLNKKGIQLEKVTLHVGLGTFQPLNTDTVEDFQIHSEYYEISPETAERLNTAKREGRRIVAVGTTSVRVLESAATDIKACGLINPGNIKYALLPNSGETAIYIYPGYEFKFVDGMITNFHLPKSSLLLLVSAFASKTEILNAYQHAIKDGYRFYSYGDGMLIL
jgi:S-adenosylmethionine:tRNA ribosyltransferase-isomerase